MCVSRRRSIAESQEDSHGFYSRRLRRQPIFMFTAGRKPFPVVSSLRPVLRELIAFYASEFLNLKRNR